MLDNYYISILNTYKNNLGKNALTLALYYVSVLESIIGLAIMAFFRAFASQLKIGTISNSKFWIVFAGITVVILFKNWMRYNGKKRHVLKAKLSAKKIPIYVLLILPVGILAIAIVLLQVK